MSPTVFREGPFRFFFFSREEERMPKAPVEAIRKLERPNPGHLYLPDLDVDLSVDSIEHPERYPLKARG